MESYEKIMVLSLGLLIFLYYSIKIILISNRYKVHFLFDYGRDYRSFKKLIESQEDRKTKQYYKLIQHLLKISAFILVLSAIAGVLYSKNNTI